MKEQKVINDIREVEEWLLKRRRIMLVCGPSIDQLEINSLFLNYAEHIVRFSEFKPNPDISSVEKGTSIFQSEKCDSLIAVGGGSAIDVAKCIRKNCTEHYGEIPFLVMPTTSGSGSEATRFAVVYRHGVKQSIEGDIVLPEIVYLDSTVLKTLPFYQKKSTMLDALSHALESWWSINSTFESRKLSKAAMQSILKYKDDYLNGTDAGHEKMLMASYTAGQAINLTRTTAGHAMSYKITGLFGVSHGHAAFMCDRVLFSHMISSLRSGEAICVDNRGKDFVLCQLTEIAGVFGGNTTEEGADIIFSFFDSLGMEIPVASEEQIELLADSVNEDRLKNHPILLKKKSIICLYRKILRSNNAG